MKQRQASAHGSMRVVLNVSEVFVSLQGEGPSRGERAVFVRLADCNLSCSWCDTSYSWNWRKYDRASEVTAFAPVDLADHVASLVDRNIRLLVLTGGEPMLQQRGATIFLDALFSRRPWLRCEVETNGTVRLNPDMCRTVHRYVVSPKLSNSQMARGVRIKQVSLGAYAEMTNSAFKFVVSAIDDLDEIGDIRELYGIEPGRVWLMPEADCLERLVSLGPLVAGLALDNGFNFSSRDHIVLWGNSRGR